VTNRLQQLYCLCVRLVEHIAVLKFHMSTSLTLAHDVTVLEYLSLSEMLYDKCRNVSCEQKEGGMIISNYCSNAECNIQIDIISADFSLCSVSKV
jgi:hypothetical protein